MKSSHSKKLIALGGITASGKTDIAIKLAKKFPLEIINADSRQVYKLLNIGTAKPHIESKKNNLNSPLPVSIVNGVPHHLLDCIDIEEEFNVSKFQKITHEIITDIWKRGNIPFLVGGTGLYIDSVILKYNLGNETIDKDLRVKLTAHSVEELKEMLQKKDLSIFEHMNESDQNNKHRLIRKIEKLSNQKNSDEFKKDSSEMMRDATPDFESLYIVLNLPFEKIEKRIKKRCSQMIVNGLLEENKKLREKGYTTNNRPLHTIGYQEFDAYFSGDQSLEETIALIEIHTRQYAKRQLTYFKRHKDLAHWSENYDEIEKLVIEFLQD